LNADSLEEVVSDIASCANKSAEGLTVRVNQGEVNRNTCAIVDDVTVITSGTFTRVHII
jgi:hypothetical protein